jgi:hypothetical protein
VRAERKKSSNDKVVSVFLRREFVVGRAGLEPATNGLKLPESFPIAL